MVAAGLVMADWDESLASYRVGVTARSELYRLFFSTQGRTKPGPLGFVRDLAYNVGYISG